MAAVLTVTETLEHLLAGTPFLDVRAEVEFEAGAVPHAVNIPILNDDERARVGTVYKNEGNEAAVKLGHELVSGENKNKKLSDWISFFEKNPDSFLTCFRGGQRSQITQRWLKEAGVDVPRVQGGYKELRQTLLDVLSEDLSSMRFLVVSGATGSGKTRLLRELNSPRTLDLEKIACHRGSAFGAEAWPQPSQVTFENAVALELMRLKQNLDLPIFIEDESRMIGMRTVPLAVFDHLRASAIVLVEESLSERTQLTYEDYVVATPIGKLELEAGLKIFENYKNSLFRISKRLGGQRFAEVSGLLQKSERDFVELREVESNREWIARLLEWYYDPLYFRSIEARKPIVAFKGTRAEVSSYLLNSVNGKPTTKE